MVKKRLLSLAYAAGVILYNPVAESRVPPVAFWYFSNASAGLLVHARLLVVRRASAALTVSDEHERSARVHDARRL